MLNGIRLDNFVNGLPKNLDNDDRTVLSPSNTVIRKYENYLYLQLNLLFGNEQTITVQGQTTQNYTIKPIKYRNILERINIVIVRDVDVYKSYYVYDIPDIESDTDTAMNKIIAQHKYMLTILAYYNSIIGELNVKSDIKRNMFFELDYHIYNNNNGKIDIGDFWYYLSHLETSDDESNDYALNIIDAYSNECIKNIKNTISLLYNSQISEYWLPFVNPDINITGQRFDYLINAYVTIINNISTYQNKSVAMSTGLVGPNTSTYDVDNSEFLEAIQNLDKFEIYAFTCSSIINNFDKKVLLTDVNVDDALNKSFDLYKENVYTFYNKLFSYNVYEDNVYSHQDDTGLIQWNINEGMLDDVEVLNLTPNYILYQDIYNPLEKYNTVTTDNILGEGNYQQLSLYDDNNEDIAYLVYGVNINIAPHYARKLYSNNSTIDILTPMFINLSDYSGTIVIIEDNVLNKTELNNLYNKIKITLEYYQTTIRHIIKMLPKSYNKEIDDTNFFKLLRALALEMAESKYDLLSVKNGVYLNDLSKFNGTYKDGDYLQEVSEDLIYNNFGSLLDLPKKEKWTSEQYRDVVTAITNVVLAGPTKSNIEEAVAKFTGYKNYIYELYKEKDNVLFSDLESLNLTYKFAIMLVKDLNKYDDSEELYKDLIYLLHIIKPAQTLFLIYILFEQSENAEVTTNVVDIFKNDDVPQVYAKWEQSEMPFGYDLRNTFETHINKNLSQEQLDDYNRSKLGGEDTQVIIDGQVDDDKSYKSLAMPKYKLKDECDNITIVPMAEVYKPFNQFTYFKTGAENAQANNDGKLTNTQYILYGTDKGEGEKLESTLELINRVYNEDELASIDLMKTSGLKMLILDNINISGANTVHTNQEATFTSNFSHIEWSCLKGNINENGVYTNTQTGTDTITVTSIIDGQSANKTINISA